MSGLNASNSAANRPNVDLNSTSRRLAPKLPATAVGSTVLFVSLLAGYPFISFFAHWLPLPPRSVTIAYRATVLALSLWLLLPRRNKSSGRLSMALSVFLLFWGMYTTRMVHDALWDPRPMFRPYWEYFVYGIGSCLIPALSLMRRSTVAIIGKSAFWPTFMVVGASCLFAVIEQREVIGTSFGRVYGNEHLSPITLGHTGVMLVFLSLYGLFGLGHASRFSLLACLVALPIGLATIAIGGSRGPGVALVGLVGMLLLMLAKRRRWSGFVVVAGSVAILGSVSVSLLDAIGSGLLDRFATTSGRIDADTETRILIWRNGLTQFLDSPLLGSGLEEEVFRSYPHNLILEAAMATGVVGLMLFVIISGMALRRAVRLVYQGAPSMAWLGFLMVHQFILAMFSGAIYGRPEFWCMVGLMIHQVLQGWRVDAESSRMTSGGSRNMSWPVRVGR